MRRELILLSLIFSVSVSYASAPKLKQKYDTETAINQEFRNVYDNFENFTPRVVISSPVVNSTGTTNINNGEIVIVSSGTYGALFFRVNNRLFQEEFKLK